MAAYINEVQFPLNYGGDGNQYIELRGTPDAQLEAGTYLVVIHSSPGNKNRSQFHFQGDIHTIFDVSNQSFGANGLLVLMQSLSRTTVDPGAKLLKGTDGFKGLPGDIFSADLGAKDILNWSNTYLLIQSAVPPSLKDNIDRYSDGVPDGVYNNWNVLDGFSVLSDFDISSFGYAPIAFCEYSCPSDRRLPGATRVLTSYVKYVGRTAQSTGYAPQDWVAGQTVEIISANGTRTGKFQLQHPYNGVMQPIVYGGRFLDHVGAPNWTGSVSGTVFRDDNADGLQQLSEPPIAGAKIFADIAGDPQVEFDTEHIEPNNYAIDSDISNTSHNVTLASQVTGYNPLKLDIRPIQRVGAPAGELIFSHGGDAFFNEDTRLRMDFYQTAKSVSIDVIGNSNTTPTYGRLQIFSKSRGWEFVRTPALGAGQRATLSLSSANADISAALAFSENGYQNSSPLGMFDNLTLVIPEQSTTTDINGNFTLPALTPGNHTIFVQPPPTYDLVYPSGNGRYPVTIVGTEHRANFNFGLIGNLPPQLADLQSNVSEATIAGSFIAELSAVRGYPSQTLKFSIASGDPDGLFELDVATGRLTLNRAELDFERTPLVTLNIKLEDTLNPALNDTAILQLAIEDANESPVVTAQSTSISENSPAQTIVATMTAVDVDAGIAGQFTWSIVGGNTGNAFTVEPATGVVRVNDASKLDFETSAMFNLVMRATDRGQPAQVGESLLTISLINVHEAPVLIGQALAIKENSAPGQFIGIINASEPEALQTLKWSVVGGSGAGLVEIGPNDGVLIVASSAKFDYESAARYDLVVQVTDSAAPQLSDMRTYTLTVTDVNDRPSLTLTPFHIPENTQAGELLGNVAGTDQDVNQQLRYSIAGGDSSLFTIDPISGDLRVAVGTILDYETDNAFAFQVTATDDGLQPLSTQVDVAVRLLDLNEAPQITVEQLTVPENSPAGFLVGAVAVRDPDRGDQVHFELLQQTLNWVSLDGQSGELVVANGAMIDFEGPSNVITVRTTDKAGLSSVATLTLSAANRNDAPTLTTPLPDATATVNEHFLYTIPAHSFTDDDAGDTLRLLVTTAAGFPIPSWLTFSYEMGVLSGAPRINDVGSYDLRVTAVDEAGTWTSDTFSIVVNAHLYPWHNPTVAFDASGDGKVSAKDALLIINYLNTVGPTTVTSGSAPSHGWLDTSRDNVVSAKDVLLIINELNQPAAHSDAESADVIEPPLNSSTENVWSWNESEWSTKPGNRRRR